MEAVKPCTLKKRKGVYRSQSLRYAEKTAVSRTGQGGGVSSSITPRDSTQSFFWRQVPLDLEL